MPARKGERLARQRSGAPVSGWRALGLFWLAVLLLLTAGALTLEMLGPLPPKPRPVASQAPASPPPAPARPVATEHPPPPPVRDLHAPIADPDPALEEPVGRAGSAALPRIGPGGRMPMRAYAAPFDQHAAGPRVGLLLAGVGLNQAESEAAIHSLPSGITLAFSPYGQGFTKLLADARAAQHEYLVSIPMEPQGFTLNDPGPEALMTSLSSEQNRQRLEWILSRFGGYVGATGALGRLKGERFAGLPELMDPVLEELSRRGLLYVDPRPNAAPLRLVWGRTVDIVIDEPANAVDIDGKLAKLGRLAHDKGSALGLATVVRPLTTQHIQAWADWLPANGFVLAPVSALVHPPPTEGPPK